MIYYTSQHLRQVMAEAGLPCSRMTVLLFEKEGVIPKPENELVYHKKVNWGRNTIRIYTEDEIKKIIPLVADYIRRRNAYATNQNEAQNASPT